MSTHSNDSPFPRMPLIAASVLVGVALVSVAAVRLCGVGAIHVPDARAVAIRELRFLDRPDGSIAVIDATQRRTIEVIHGQSGFLRGTLRGLVRERKREGIGDEPAFRLIGREDGRLTLEDPSTGRRVDLESFGPVNAGVFAQMLVVDKNTP